MKFRLATGGQGGEALTSGVGNFFRSLAMAPVAELQAAEQAQESRAKRDLQAAQMRMADASASKATEDANATRTQTERGGLGPLLEAAAMQQGIAPSEAKDFSVFAQTGQLANRFDASQGPAMPVPSFYGKAAQPDFAQGQPVDDTAAKIYRTLGLMQNSLALGKGNVADIAKGAGEYQDQQITDQAVAMAGRGDDMGMSRLNSIRGKKEFTPFSAVGSTGTALNQITGNQDVANPAMAALFGDQGRAEIGRDKAAAAASYASAEDRKASAAKTRMESEQGSRGVLRDTENGLVLVDPRTGTAKPVLGADGAPLTKGAGNVSEGERKAGTLLARLRGSQEQLLTALGESPSAAKPRTIAELVRAIPIVGGNTPANLVTPEARQRVEAAQLDMLDAALTLGTGAAYTKEQLQGYTRSYFPQIGDGPKQIADKQVRLANVIRAAEIAAGKAERLVPKPSESRAPSNDGPASISSDAEYNALPSGTVFIGPDGKQRRKP